MTDYNICSSEEQFKIAIYNHYHGDYGLLYSTPANSPITIWQCSCGYRSIANMVLNFNIIDLIKQYDFVRHNPVALIDLPDNPQININNDAFDKRKEALIEWMTRSNMKHENK